MKKEYHILNGDALHERIKDLFSVEFIICREAFIEGPLDFKKFYEKRAAFFGVSLKEYKEISTSQFDAIQYIPDTSDICLWFEDDLFCQCNLWFIIDMILSLPLKANIYLIRPTTNSWLGFGDMHEKTFAEAYNKKVLLNKNQLEDFQKLWNIYSQKEEGDLMTSGIKLKSLIPRIENVLQAQLDREDGKNRPLESLKRILTESEDHSFSNVFKAFSKKEGIYGFGDTSIKKMYDELMKS